MGLLIAVVPGSFGRLQDSVRYKDTLRAVIAEMRDARYRASMERREVRFSVDLKSRQFGIEGKEFKRFADGIEIRATVADKELDPNGVASIRFLPQGGQPVEIWRFFVHKVAGCALRLTGFQDK